MTFESRIKALERLAGVRVPGTVIQRVLMDNSLVIAEGLSPNGDRQSTSLWSVGIGEPSMPKLFGYGLTIGEALTAVEKKIKAYRRSA